MGKIKIVYHGGQSQTEEKKSKFICTVQPVNTEEEALAFVAQMKKKYWDAAHNCPAYVIGDRQQTQRCSDDGEPQGTAGRPMLDVLLGEDVHNVCVVVTRYFGGTLLGTGGLVRAYSKAVQEGLKASAVVEKTDGILLTVHTDYTGLGKVQYLLGQRGLKIIDSRYGAEVELDTLLPEEDLSAVYAEITEGTSGRAQFPQKKQVKYAFLDGEPVFF